MIIFEGIQWLTEPTLGERKETRAVEYMKTSNYGWVKAFYFYIFFRKMQAVKLEE